MSAISSSRASAALTLVMLLYLFLDKAVDSLCHLLRLPSRAPRILLIARLYALAIPLQSSRSLLD